MDVARIVLSGMWLQDADSVSSGDSKLLMIFVGLVAVAMVVQAIAADRDGGGCGEGTQADAGDRRKSFAGRRCR